MDTILTIISAVLAIAALVLCICTWRALRPVSKPQPRAGYKHGPLERRREALQLATKAWLYSVEHGFVNTERREKQVMERLEREVAAMENEPFGTKEEATPKPEAPKNEPVAVIRCGCHEPCKVLYYKTQCSFCEWSGSSFSKETAEARRVKHEGKHV